jgi:RND family efflux transporter MFP subunit
MELKRPKSEPRADHAAPAGLPAFVLGFDFRHASLAIAAAALLAAGCGKHSDSTTPGGPGLAAATVRTEMIQPRKLMLTEDVVGTVRARQSVELAARINGRITALPVVLGQAVKEGDLLVTLATQDVAARLDQAQAVLRQIEADFARLTRLQQTGAATPSELDAITNRRLGAQAAVAEAEAMLTYGRITAPISGVVARKDAETGDLAMPGKPLLRLENPASLRLEAEVPASVLARVKAGDSLAVRVEAVGVELMGKVSEIAPLADPATRSVRVRLDLPPTPGLLPGQFGRVALPLAEAEVLIVPPASLVRRGQLDLVFIVRDGTAQMRLVRVGRTLAGGVEILAGLNPGESVVVQGATELVDGQGVK